ncbi:MAG: T9SS type A sorting domain-containing protein [Saprospiraceae bacterium]|nr:T9SS type A sorting domain-containing protein [Saprospiraceae bacterium]
MYDVLQIEILKGMQTEFVLMDALGKELKRISFNDKQHTENLSELKPGVYFIQSVSGTEKRSFVKM